MQTKQQLNNSIMAVALGAMLSFAACATKESLEPRIEYYYPSFRQLPPEPVYSRLTWSQVPGPFPIKSQDDAPLLSPPILFELPHSNLGEALTTFAQTIGYEGRVPKELEKRPVSLKMVGTIDQILAQIEKKAGVRLELDRERRMIRVIDEQTVPVLPSSR